jgi:hypothetical protein
MDIATWHYHRFLGVWASRESAHLSVSDTMEFPSWLWEDKSLADCTLIQKTIEEKGEEEKEVQRVNVRIRFNGIGDLLLKCNKFMVYSDDYSHYRSLLVHISTPRGNCTVWSWQLGRTISASGCALRRLQRDCSTWTERRSLWSE